MLIYITENDGINKKAVELLMQSGHTVLSKEPSSEMKKKVDVLFIRTYTTINSAYLEAYPNVKYILRAGVGLDNIDLEECKKRNILVINAPGSNANAVAEFVIGTIIQLSRKISTQSALLKQGKWRDKEYIGSELTGKTIGLLGCGAIGKLISYKLQVFGVAKILGYDPYLDEKTLLDNNIIKSELDAIFQTADVVSLHLPLTAETKNLISLKEMKTMKKTAFLINTSRGGIVNENALIIALKKGIIGGAALDVFVDEPNINKGLLGVQNLILTPHVAGFTEVADEKMSLIPAEKFLSSLK